MDNYYFTYWIKKHGREKFRELSNKVCEKTTVPLKIRKKYGKDEYLFHYFYVVYYTIVLHYFGLDTTQISMILDISLTPGVSKLFSPAEILEVQKDVIPEIEQYILEDLKSYSTN